MGEEKREITSEIIVLLPASDGAYSAKVFASKKEVRKLLGELPKDAIFYKGRKLEPRVKTIITL